MYCNYLIKELTELAKQYGTTHIGNSYNHFIATSENAVIFKDIESNFHKKGWSNIKSIPKDFKRTLKIHSHFDKIIPTVYEMQSSNSSDALAMNIFCFPKFKEWKGTLKLFNIEEFSSIDFGFKPKVIKIDDNKIKGDASEVDIFINRKIICECKLKEGSFTQKKKSEVHKYVKFEEIFHIDKLIQEVENYDNYQLIRNILAAEQHNSRFILICDMRRPDLAKSFYQTIRCIKDEYLELRNNCDIIYWQDIARVTGKELKDFLKEKYGIV